MPVYALYLESGPQRRKTMVHVPELLGCIAQGATTEAALAVTPEAIREYVRFLRRHREPCTPTLRAAVETAVALHALGGAEPDEGFAPDLAPLTPADRDRYLHRLACMQDELIALLRGRSEGALRAKPPSGRPLAQILGHVAGAQYAYLQSPLAKPAGLSAAVRRVEQGPDPLAAFEECCALARTALASVAGAALRARERHGARTWTARRGFRRSLEHQWEHLLEVRARLGA